MCVFKKPLRKTGFTLAEILITLLIIGVVSSMVIPALIADTQKAELYTAFKKVYSDLDQATRRIMIDNGGTMIGILNANNNSLNTAYLAYLNTTKNCNISYSANGNCWHSDNTWKYLNGNNASSFYSSKTGAILSNGSLLGFWTENTAENCDVGAIHSCGIIMVDVNGFKAPNIVGRDIFMIHVIKNGIKPFGSQWDGSAACSTSNTGLGCAGKVLIDGEMNY